MTRNFYQDSRSVNQGLGQAYQILNWAEGYDDDSETYEAIDGCVRSNI
jgi:hypothetical protein